MIRFLDNYPTTQHLELPLSQFYLLKRKNKLPTVLPVCAFIRLILCQSWHSFAHLWQAIWAVPIQILSSSPFVNVLAQHPFFLVFWSQNKIFSAIKFHPNLWSIFSCSWNSSCFWEELRGKETLRGFQFILVCKARREAEADFIPINSRYCFLNIVLVMKQLYCNKTTHESQALHPRVFLQIMILSYSSKIICSACQAQH